MKALILFLTTFAILVFSTGCCDKVNIPVSKKCPQVECESVEGKTNAEVLKVMLSCLKERELALEVCK